MALSRSDCDSRTPASRFGESSQSAAVSVDATSSTVKDVVIWFGSKVYLKISGLEFIARKKIARANFKSRCFEKKKQQNSHSSFSRRLCSDWNYRDSSGCGERRLFAVSKRLVRYLCSEINIKTVGHLLVAHLVSFSEVLARASFRLFTTT